MPSSPTRCRRPRRPSSATTSSGSSSCCTTCASRRRASTRRWTRWPTRCCSTSRPAPLRVSALAEVVHSDVSTVSRQVSTLVDLGFVIRGPDPDDGRAQALTLTDEGTALLHRHPDDARAMAPGPARRLGPTTTSSRSRSTCGTSPPTSRPPCPRSPEGPTDDRLHPARTGRRLATGSGPGAHRRRPAGPPHGPLTHRQIVTILIGLMMGMFLAALDQTIVATAMRTIADDLRGLEHQAWATTAYLITATIVTPLYGKLGDIYGRKKLFIIAISIFIFGSVLCTFATSMGSLALFRAVQGLGAGGLFSLALAIIGDIVPPRERAKYQGYFLAVFGTASVLGPVIGGFFAGQETILGIAGWRWVFLVNVPIGIAALAVVSQDAPPAPPPPRPPHRLGRRRAAVGRPRAAAPRRRAGPRVGLDVRRRPSPATSSASLGAIGFFWQEWRMKEEAILPLAMFRNKTVGVSSIASVLIGVAMFGGLAALPLYLQIVKGATPTEAGLLLLPMTLGIMVGSILSGQIISRTGSLPDVPDHRVRRCSPSRSSSSTTSSTTPRSGRP